MSAEDAVPAVPLAAHTLRHEHRLPSVASGGSCAGRASSVLDVLLQLSGVPGSGKSTLARGLSAALGLVVLDTDVVKSALLSRDLGVGAAGPASYGVVLALAADLLTQGHEVVI